MTSPLSNSEEDPTEPTTGGIHAYAKHLSTVRSRATLLLNHPEHLTAFDLHLDQLPVITQTILDLIQRDYGGDVAKIRMHSRSRHLDAGGKGRLAKALSTWESDGNDALEKCKRMLDLSVVSVLLDAGAGDSWSYSEPSTGDKYNRSEGLAVASYDWFLNGGFYSGNEAKPIADAAGLLAITAADLIAAFQVSPENPLVGVEGRVSLLNRLGQVCLDHPDVFGVSCPRPGNVVDYLLSRPSTTHLAVDPENESTAKYKVDLGELWTLMMDVLVDIWPKSRTIVYGKSLGDVWHCKALSNIASDPSIRLSEADLALQDLIPFHKLSQWLTYSLIEPLLTFGVTFTGLDQMTGLAEYRNGGLFIDYGVLIPKLGVDISKPLTVDSEVVVEWRGLTVALLDVVGAQVRAHYGVSEEALPLVKILEAGTWKAGREIAARLRPASRGPPLTIISDGTVF